MSQLSHNTFASTIASGDSLLGNSQDSRQSETLVEIETGDSDVSAVLKFIVANQSSTKSHKSSPVWKFFAHFDSAHHPDKKNYRICLVCRDEGSDKAVSVGKDSSPAPLISHLRTHKEQYMEFLEAQQKLKAPQKCSGQTIIGKFLSTKSEAKDNFKRKFARWIVEDSMPLTMSRSVSFRNMIRAANKTIDVPSYSTLLSFLQSTKLGAVSKMKAFIKGKYFSITMDHWTSLANENYGAITLHLIDDFKLLTFVLSCMKHENGCTANEMEKQLKSDLNQWELDKSLFVCCVTDSAANMNALGEKMEQWRDAPLLRHHYCADHILQRTAVMAYSGNIPSPDINDEDNSVSAVRKARDLVSYVNSSVIATEKIRSAQKKMDTSNNPLKLLSDVETRWWSTHTLVDRVLKMKDCLCAVFESEFRCRESSNTPTTLEILALTEDDFLALSDILHLLTPFKDAQKALEGEFYVNLSLLPLVVLNLDQQLQLCQAGVDELAQQSLYELITTMIEDFHIRWGQMLSYSSVTKRTKGHRQTGIPTYSFWAMALDPRTKKKVSKTLSECDCNRLWKDLTDAVLDIARENINMEKENGGEDNSNSIPVVPRRLSRHRGKPNKAAQFIVESSDEEEDAVEVEDPLTLELSIRNEIKRYQLCKGCPLTGSEGEYLCPLEWWKLNCKEFPNIWKLAIRILSIPATSAPSERVFSSAANVVNKKRVRLDPDTVDLLIYLRGNKEFVDWGD